MRWSGVSPDDRLVEFIELRDHPWFVATQAHPELKSRPNRPHPLFRDFVGAAAARIGLPTAATEVGVEASGPAKGQRRGPRKTRAAAGASTGET
jgi:hypothetical protein